MAYKVSDLYGKIIYSGDSDYDCKLFINGDRIPVEQISSIKISSPIIDTTEETGTIFHIGTFISQSITIKFRNLDGLDLTSNPSIYLEIGLKVGEEYEYVPIGEYIIDDLGENYQTSCEITCLDYAVKFKTNVDITQFFDENGEITAAQLFEALCNYYGVGIGTYPTINNNKKIRFYDNTLSGKTYISYLAELFGGNAKMGRDGKLYIISLNPTEVKEYEGETIYIEKSMPVNAPFKLNGNAEQETRSGKNEFDKRLIESVINGTYKNDILKNTPGQMNLQIVTSGITLSANTQYIVFKAKLESGTYSGGFSSIQCLDGNGFALTAVSNPSLSSEYKEYIFSKEITEGKTFKNILFQLFRNTNAVVLIKDIMITTSSDTTYEQYGASPSPDYPSPVKTVGQNVNIFDKDNANKTKIYFTKTSMSIGSTSKTLYIKCKPNTTYTIRKIASTKFRVATTNEIPASGAKIIDYMSNDKGKDITLTTSSTTNYLSVYYYDSSTDTLTEQEILDSIKIEKGLVATPYSPYGQGSVEIEVCNKNLAKINETNWELTENNTIKNKAKNDATKLATISLKKGQTVKVSIKLKSKPTVDTSLTASGISNIGFIRIDRFELDKANTITYTATEDVEIVYKLWGNANSGIFEFQFWAEIDEATDYIPHESYTKILPIQQEMLDEDYISDKEYHTWGKVVLTGNEDNWQWNSGNFAFISVPNIANKPTTQVLVKSNYFLGIEVGSNGTNYFDKDNVVFSWFSGALICIKSTQNFTNIEETKAFLQEKYNSGNPVVVYYKLATPKSLPLTEEQKEVMNGGIQLYEDITNITTDNNLAILNVKATTKVEPIEIDALTSKKFEVGDTYEITRVCYDNGITKFQAGGNVISVEELPTEEIYSNSYYYLTKDMKYYKYKEETQEWEIDPTIKNTLYIRQDNMFITTQEEIDNIYNLLKGFKIQNINCENRSDLSLDCWDMIKYTTDKGEYYTLNDNEITFSGVSMGKVITNIPTGTKAETTNIIEGSSEQKIRKVQTQINEVEGTLKIVAEETTQIKGQTDENTTNINNNYNEILQKLEGYATEDDIITVNNKVETMQSSTDFAINVIEDIQANGVSKVKTTTGYTFDENGLEVSKTGAETKSVLNEKGLNVKDNTGSSEESLLFAGYDEKIGETIVKSKNMTVQKYLVIGKYSRVEDYHEGTGVFWIGGN